MNQLVASKERLIHLRKEELKLDVAAFAAATEVSEQYIYNLESLKSAKTVSLKMVMTLTEKFGVSPSWLLLGEGPIYVSQVADVRTLENDLVSIPILDAETVALYPQHYQDEAYLTDRPVFQLPFPSLRNKHCLAFQISGHAMEETIQHLDYMVCSEVTDFAQAEQGHVYVVLTTNGVMCKRLLSRTDAWTWGSDNAQYGTATLHTAEMHQLWRVEWKVSGSLRRAESQDSPRLT